MLMLIISGMHEYLLKALLETFTLIPINGAVNISKKYSRSAYEKTLLIIEFYALFLTADLYRLTAACSFAALLSDIYAKISPKPNHKLRHSIHHPMP